MSREGYAVALERAVPWCTVFSNGQPGLTYYLPCRECCSKVNAFHTAVKFPVEKVHRVFVDRGWHIGNRSSKHLCPEHSRAPAKIAATPTPNKEPKMAEVIETNLSDKARIARREAVLLLADFFDLASVRFKGDDSDVTFSTAVQLAPSSVAKLREEFYGPLKVPTEMEALRAEVAALKVRLEETRSAAVAEFTRNTGSLLNSCEDMGKRINAAIAKFS